MKSKFQKLFLGLSALLMYPLLGLCFSDSLKISKLNYHSINTIEFKEIDNIIDNSGNVDLSIPPPSDPSFASQFMVGLGKAHISDEVKKAKEICDKAIEVGRFIDKLTGGNLESMPIVKKQKFGATDIYIIFQSAKMLLLKCI